MGAPKSHDTGNHDSSHGIDIKGGGGGGGARARVEVSADLK